MVECVLNMQEAMGSIPSSTPSPPKKTFLKNLKLTYFKQNQTSH
jgi:hypothetical protein